MYTWPLFLAFYIPLIFALYQLKISEICTLLQPIKWKIFCILRIIPFIFVICSYLETLTSYDEEKLLSYLFDNYTSATRPALNDRDTVNVTLGLTLSQIIDVVRFCHVFFNISIFRISLSYCYILKTGDYFSNKVITVDWQGPKYASAVSKLQNPHCVKSVLIRNFSGTYFLAFGLNTEIYKVNLRIQSKCAKITTRKIPNTDTFQPVPGKVIQMCSKTYSPL